METKLAREGGWPRRTKALGVALLAMGAMALLAAACSPSSTEGGQAELDAADGLAGGGFAGVTIDSSTIEELSEIRFSGIDLEGDLSKLELQILVDGFDPIDLPLYLDATGVHTVFPLHPEHPGEGGPAALRLREGDEQSRVFDLEVTGLPEAPGAWDQAIDEIVEELETRAELLGTSLSELASMAPDEAGDEAAIIKLIAGYVDDGTDNDLESLLVAPGEELTAEEIALVDALVAKIDPLQMIPSTTGDGHLEIVGAAEAGSSAVSDLRSFTGVRALAQAATCRRLELSIDNGAELAAAVEKGRGGMRSPDGALDKLTKDVAALSGQIGKVPIVGQALGAFVGAVDTMYATMALWSDADAGMYPTTFTSLTAEASHATFNEDYTEPGRVSAVVVVAASTGFDASVGFEKVASKAADAIVGMMIGKLKGETPDAVGDAVLEAGGKLRGAATSTLLKEYGKRYLQFCPRPWTVDISDPAYAEISPVIGRIEVNKQAMTYQPVELGEDILRVQTRSGVFSGASARTDLPVETKRLQVISTPSEIVVKRAGDIVGITTGLKNADTTTLFWDAAQGKWADGMLQPTNDGGTRLLTTPSDKDLYPFFVTVESTSDTGLRRNASDVRNDSVLIKLQSLFVSPDPGKVRTTQTLQFTATDGDGKPRKVTWKATGGTIGDTGLYTAGKEPGTFSVTATAVDDPGVIKTVAVEIYDGECLIGTWVLRSQEMLEQFAAGSGVRMTHQSGEQRLVVRDDGTYTAFRDAWSFDSETPKGIVRLMYNDEDSGTWRTTETELFLETSGGGSYAPVEILVYYQGKWVNLPTGPRTVEVPPVSGQFTYTCEDDLLTFASGTLILTADRIGN